MMKAVRIISLVSVFVFFSSSSFSDAHPLKMSFSKLEISSEGVVDLQSRIFLDDITAQMQDLYNLDTVDFSTVESKSTQALQRYLTNHYYFEQDGIKSELIINAVSFSRNKLALVLLMSTDIPLDTSKEVFLTNTVLCDASPKQKNDILYLEKHFLLNSGNPSVQIELN